MVYHYISFTFKYKNGLLRKHSDQAITPVTTLFSQQISGDSTCRRWKYFSFL